jgi:mRNA-degrading endonuclease RelE of RelBE toxin-antitoxin system
LPHEKIIKEKLLILTENPEIMKNNIKLAGANEDHYILRIGNYRVIYKEKEKELVILITRIGHRREGYL